MKGKVATLFLCEGGSLVEVRVVEQHGAFQSAF